MYDLAILSRFRLLIETVRRTYAPNEFKAGVYNGLYNNQTSLSENQPSCPSGKCSWPLYSTLAFCAYVADVSQYIQTHTYSSTGFGETEFYMLPSGAILATGYEMVTLRSTADGFDSLVFQNTTSLIDFYTFLHSKKKREIRLSWRLLSKYALKRSIHQLQMERRRPWNCQR